jgi:DNA polymerase III subunit delta'
MAATVTLPGTESQPHAAAVLGPALPPAGTPSHAYLFHGPRGSGKRAAARAFASALLSDRVGMRAADADIQAARADVQAADADMHVAERVANETHPDLTWVRPSGAAEMLVADIDEPVVAAATRTPFEARRRVFVIEGADTMNDRAANRLLKTLEEPPAFVHLILLADRQEDVLPTIVSRCQLVRFDPLPPAAIERLLADEVDSGADQSQTLAACARIALGDAELATRLRGSEGTRLRAAARTLVQAVLGGGDPDDVRPSAGQPWDALLAAAGAAGASAAEQASAAVQAELELLPAKERRRREREGLEAGRRIERRQRTQALDVGLRLVELWLRDLLCLVEGAPQLIHARDEPAALQADLAALRAEGANLGALPQAIGLVVETRLSLAQNVSEELALEALCHRLQSAIGPRFGVRP